MPYLAITTNAALTPDTEASLTADATKSISAKLGKPEAYVMVSVQSIQTLSFGASREPAAFLDLRSIGLPGSVNGIASALTDLMEKHAAVKPNRVFITFSDVAASRWAQGGATFA